ncbi:MAG: Ribosomal RNA small subunit methyltransferase I [Deltaproteobacteria bacterium ADurb.Bin510]|nr:MAG: Ribosomal RNA small subunit methyltransferase I [Deltaproteobacteria bacterium ADurb.Bin510]
MEKPGLYIVPTPIGNLKDITLRALETLQSVDLIACEDTRHSLKLLNHYGIRKPLMACEKFSEAGAGERIAALIDEGKRVALISDAGMPAVSDPGARLVARLVSAGLHVEALPGACAFVTALAAAGMDGPLRFIGFFPRKAGEAAAEIGRIAVSPETTIFYESPRRIATTVARLANALPQRRACLAREISKLHEEYLRGTLEELAAHLEGDEQLGEWVGLIEATSEVRCMSQAELEIRARELLAGGASRKEALAELVRETGLGRNRIYKLLMELD